MSVRSPKFAYLIVPVLLVCLFAQETNTWAQQGRSQSISQMKQRREKLEEELELNERLLKQTRQTKEQSFHELKLLNRKIEIQKQIVQSLNQEVSDIASEIEEIGTLISSLEFDLKQLYQSYTKAARVTYEAQNNLNVLLWLLASDNFDQAYDRMKYFEMFRSFRQDQIQSIKSTRRYLENRKKAFENRKAKKEELLAQRISERKKLAATKAEKQELYAELKQKEQRYRRRVDEYKQSLAKIKNEIKRQIRLAKRRNVSKAERDRIYKLSQTFTKNKNRLPWPVPMPKGVITGQFGKAKDVSGGIINNEGIYISTVRGQSVRSIFKGEVTLVSEIASFGQVVIIKHGTFRTVYANLNKLFVEEGDQVETLQNIGTVKTNRSTGDTQLYFQIYKDYTPVNPSRWIAQK